MRTTIISHLNRRFSQMTEEQLRICYHFCMNIGADPGRDSMTDNELELHQLIAHLPEGHQDYVLKLLHKLFFPELAFDNEGSETGE